MSSFARVYSYSYGAGETKKFPGGRFFKLITAAAEVTVNFFTADGEEMASFVGVKSGLKVDLLKFVEGSLPLVGFGRVEIISASAQVVACIISRQPIDYDNVSTSVEVSSATANPTTADVSLAASATTLIKAAGTRKKILITNLAAGAENIRLGDVNTGAARGIELAPGMTAEMETSGAVYGYNPSAATAQSVGILELT